MLPRVSSYLTLHLKIDTGTKWWAETRGLYKKGSPGWDEPGRRGSPEGGRGNWEQASKSLKQFNPGWMGGGLPPLESFPYI